MKQSIRIGVDLGKRYFQVHALVSEDGRAVTRKLRRSGLLAFFADVEPCLIGMEACGSAHYWARELRAMGHDVRLIPPIYVKPYVERGKNDAVDAAAVCEALSRPGMRFAPIKSAENRATLMHMTNRRHALETECQSDRPAGGDCRPPRVEIASSRIPICSICLSRRNDLSRKTRLQVSAGLANVSSSMAYVVKEAFKTLQGEGRQAGRVAVFCRFAGCNLWSGREQDRAGAACAFCDTDFVGADGENGGKYPNAESLAALVARLWGPERRRRFVVLTGGEPMLQVDAALIDALHGEGFEVAVETNGTLPVPASIDWICVSPKAGGPLVQVAGDELKLVFPQEGAEPELFEELAFDHFLLQPMDGPELVRNTRAAIDYCLAHPRWRFSLQTHKAIGVK